MSILTSPHLSCRASPAHAKPEFAAPLLLCAAKVLHAVPVTTRPKFAGPFLPCLSTERRAIFNIAVPRLPGPTKLCSSRALCASLGLACFAVSHF